MRDLLTQDPTFMVVGEKNADLVFLLRKKFPSSMDYFYGGSTVTANVANEARQKLD